MLAGLACQKMFHDAYPKPSKHSSASVSDKPAAGDHTQISSRVLDTIELSAADLAMLYGTSVAGPQQPTYPCGQGPNAFVLCANGAVPPAGSFLLAASVTEATIPLTDGTNHLEYAFVFDSDGNTANNWVGFPAFPNDFFIGSDRWYVAKYDPGSGWSIEVSTANGQTITPASSDARIFIRDNVLVLLVPASEMTVSQPNYRVTAFRHTGDFGINPPHDWDGTIFPAVADGLAPYDVLPPLAP